MVVGDILPSPFEFLSYIEKLRAEKEKVSQLLEIRIKFGLCGSFLLLTSHSHYYTEHMLVCIWLVLNPMSIPQEIQIQFLSIKSIGNLFLQLWYQCLFEKKRLQQEFCYLLSNLAAREDTKKFSYCICLKSKLRFNVIQD